MTRRQSCRYLVAVGVCGLFCCITSCDDAFNPDVGGRTLAACDPRDSDEATNVSYERDIIPLILRDRMLGGCSCHQSQASSHIGFDLSGFDLTNHDTMRRGGAGSGEDIIVPGDPCVSILYLKLGYSPPFGSRMPLSGPPFWSNEERGLLHDWIAEGAHDN
jgi:hypothetical protein